MVDLKVSPIPAETIFCAAGLLSPETLGEICDGMRLTPGCFALGAWENSSLKGVLAGRGESGGDFELLEIEYKRALRPETGLLLLRAFERLANAEDAVRLSCRFSVPAEELVAFAQPFAVLDWERPTQLATLFYVETPTKDLHRRTKTHEAAGEVLPLCALPPELCLRYLESHDDSCDFTRLGALVPELSLGYVEGGELLGYIAFVPGPVAVEAVRVRLPEDRAAGGVLISRAAEVYSTLGYDAMILRVEAEYGEKVSRQLFGDQILSTQLLMQTEKTLRRDAE